MRVYKLENSALKSILKTQNLEDVSIHIKAEQMNQSNRKVSEF